ncbi:MAG TPA: BTAD domain-containing putative transcriptional regulator [Candidatus Limnocylindria bacterium]|nr:BTAD domain-containing putative transcriptional regulator [Candidatus Limnocylindria bacterium]
MPQLRVFLFGAPRAVAGRTVIVTDTRKATALLAYLAVSEQPQRRGVLAALLWPEADEQKARGALRRTLSVLRSALRDRWLLADGETVDLDRANVLVDVLEFRRALREGRLEEAVALYGGDFLAGFSLRDSPQFDDWQAAEADALRASFGDALSHLAATAERDGDLSGAIARLKSRLAVDPLHEPAHRDLMRLYARSGDRAAALRQFREAARLLDNELGVAPLEETRALHEAIEAGTLREESASPEARTATALGDLHTLHGDYRRAIESYEAAAAKAPASARAGIELKLAQVHHRRGDWTKAERHYAAAGKASVTDGERARILADWSLAAHRSGDPARAKRLANEALGLAERSQDKRALAQAHNILGVLGAAGRRAHLETSVTLARELGDREAHAAALNNLALALREAGDLGRARELTEEALAECEALGDRHRTAALHNNLADVLRAQGQKDDAMRHLKRAVRLFSEIGEAGTTEPEVWKLVAW